MNNEKSFSLLERALNHESINIKQAISRIANGTNVLLCSKHSSKDIKFTPKLVGSNTKKKICVAIGMDSNSTEHFDEKELNVILNAEPDVICDVSIGDNITRELTLLRSIIHIPLGSTPTYDILNERVTKEVTKDYVLSKLESHLKTGVDFVLIHFGFCYSMLEDALNSKRIMPTTSRGGGAIMKYMKLTNCENPFLLYADEIIQMCISYDVALDLGDVFRTGCLEDGKNINSENSLKVKEVEILTKVMNKARRMGAKVVCEGGGHIPLFAIKDYVLWLKHAFNNAPLFFNGPLPTDRAVSLDGTANAIGVTYAAQYGGDMFLPLTDAEHYTKPTPLQSANAIRQVKVALSAVEYSLGDKQEVELNHQMGQARQDRNWNQQAKLSLYPKLTQNLFKEFSLDDTSKPCSLCGPMCPLLYNKK